MERVTGSDYHEELGCCYIVCAGKSIPGTQKSQRDTDDSGTGDDEMGNCSNHGLTKTTKASEPSEMKV